MSFNSQFFLQDRVNCYITLAPLAIFPDLLHISSTPIFWDQSILLFACPGADPHGRTTRPLSSGFWLGSANGEPWQKLGGEGDSLWPVSPFIGGNLSSHGSLLFVGFFQFPGKGSPPIPRSDGNCSIMMTYRPPSLRLPCALPTPLQTAPQP